MTVPNSFKLEKEPRNHERVFIEHYASLMDWARQLTQGTPQEAHDLVQDLYVRFVQMKSAPAFTDERQTRVYLYKALKNLFISRKLRHGRDAISGLLVSDFDSVEYALTAVDRTQLLHVRSDLAGICEYACIRRKTHRAATAFILRFFFGYAPTEVMALIRANRASVDVFIQTARQEAKTYLRRPSVLRFLDRSDKKPLTFPRYLPEDSDALFTELQRRIFSEKEGSCLPLEELEDRYASRKAGGFSAVELAHLASCRLCLHRATQILGIPDLTLGFTPDAGDPGDAGPPTTGTVGDDLKKLRRKLRETYEHRPKKLQIIVDGEVRGVQTVTASINKVQLKLQPLSQPSFLEVLSEQGHDLLYLDLEQESLDQPIRRHAEVALSDGRLLSVTVSMADGGPVIDLYYYDPVFDEKIDEPPSAPALDISVPTRDETEVPDSRSAPHWKLLSWVRRRWNLARRHHLLGIGVGIVLGIIALCVVIIQLKAPHPLQLSAVQLLARSSEQNSRKVPVHGAVRAAYTLAVRDAGSRLIVEDRVDILRSQASPRAAVQLRSTSGSVLGSCWTDAAGKKSKLSHSQSSGDTEADPTEDVSSQDLWLHTPDASDFKTLAGDQPLNVTAGPGTYDVHFARLPQSNAPTVIEGHLVLASATLHPLSEALRVQRGKTIRDYSFTEASYEVLRADQIADRDFEPQAAAFVPKPRTPARAPANTSLKLQVLQLLGLSGNEIERDIDLEPLSGGRMSIHGVLPTKEQKQVLLHAIRALGGTDDLLLDVHVAGERMHRPGLRPTRVELLDPVAAASGRVSFDALLRNPALAEGLTDEVLETEVRTRANQILNAGSRLHREAWLVGQIGSQDFSQKEILAMSPSQKRTWLSLLKQHLQASGSALREIESVLPPEKNRSALPPAGPGNQSLNNVGELTRGMEGLRRSSEQLDQLFVAGFALSPAAPTAPHNSSEVFPLLDDVEYQESRLTFTVDRLQQILQQRHTR